jgi:hypothetical protein
MERLICEIGMSEGPPSIASRLMEFLMRERDVKPLQRKMRTRFWVEIAAASLTGVLFMLALVWKDWLEAFGFEPDNHDGTVEWLMVAGLFVLSAAFAVSARLEWRRTALAQ